MMLNKHINIVKKNWFQFFNFCFVLLCREFFEESFFVFVLFLHFTHTLCFEEIFFLHFSSILNLIVSFSFFWVISFFLLFQKKEKNLPKFLIFCPSSSISFGFICSVQFCVHSISLHYHHKMGVTVVMMVVASDLLDRKK